MPTRARPATRATRTTRPTRATKARTPDTRAATAAFGRLVRIMAALRSPHGCPWDVKQTHTSLRPYLIEETYEALDAIDRGDIAALPGELGDVLLQCVFHAQIAAEAGTFNITRVVQATNEKLIRRHPHVFTAKGALLPPKARQRQSLTTAEAVLDQWGRLKAREQVAAGAPDRVLAGLPRALPSLLRASRIGARVAAVGFDWPTPGAISGAVPAGVPPGVIDKIEEEVRELRQALTQSGGRTLDEFGDVLFSLANLARHLHIDPEIALRHANDKFTRRFTMLEADLEARGQSVRTASPDTLEEAWKAVKQKEDAPAPPSTAARTRSSRGSRGRRSRS